MSAVSDKFERDVANYINDTPGVKASRPVVGTGYPDVLVEHKSVKSWMEVKMNHTDNLANPRFFYMGGRWGSTYKTPVAKYGIMLLDKDPFTKEFIKTMSKLAGIPLSRIQLHSTKAGLRDKNTVPLDLLKQYFSRPTVNRYIANKPEVDISKLVVEHYTIGKTAPAHYIQAGDDLYRLGNQDPFKFGAAVPALKGMGAYKVRVATRSEFYEIQAEVKLSKITSVSKYSFKPGTLKKNPFL